MLWKVVANVTFSGIEHKFRGGNGTPEIYECQSPQEEAILFASPLAEEVRDPDAKPYIPPPGGNRPRVTVGPVTTHDDTGAYAPPLAPEPDDESDPQADLRQGLDEMDWKQLRGDLGKGVWKVGMTRPVLTEKLLEVARSEE